MVQMTFQRPTRHITSHFGDNFHHLHSQTTKAMHWTAKRYTPSNRHGCRDAIVKHNWGLFQGFSFKNSS